MTEPHCFVCGMVAGYEDVSDGDFDTENNICYPCSVEDKERHWTTPRNQKPNYSECSTDEPPTGRPVSWENVPGGDWQRLTLNTGRHYFYNKSTKESAWELPDDEPPSWSLISQKNLKEYSISLEEMSDRTWELCIRDGLPPIYKCSEWSIRAGGWTMEEYIQRDAKNKRLYMLREIDLLGPKNIKKKLGRWVSPLNRFSTTKHPIKSANTCNSNFGGGGGGGRVF